jgi:hypothetical protein
VINEGTLDRVIRVVLGLGILSLAFVSPKSALGHFGIVQPGRCPCPGWPSPFVALSARADGP